MPRTTTPIGSLIGITLMRSVRSMMTSASLPGRQRADFAVEAVRLRALDRRELQHVAAGQHLRQVGLAAQPALVDLAALQRQHRAHLRERSPHIVVSTSTLRLGRRPRSRQRWIGGVPCPICSSIGEASDTVPPVSANHLEFVVAERAAVDVGGVGAEQTGLAHLAEPAVLARFADADVHADPAADLARQIPVVLRDFGRRELGAARRERQRDEPVARREVLLRDAADVVRVLQAAVVPPRAEVEVRRAVGEHGAEAPLLQRRDRRVGVLRRVLDVRPVEQRRDAGVDRAVARSRGCRRRRPAAGRPARARRGCRGSNRRAARPGRCCAGCLPRCAGGCRRSPASRWCRWRR